MRGHSGLGIALSVAGLVVAVGPLAVYRRLAAHLLARGQVASITHALTEYAIPIAVFVALGAALAGLGAFLLRSAAAEPNLLGGLILVVPGALVTFYGVVQILCALRWLWSGGWHNAGYGFAGSVVFSIGVFGVPLVVLGVMLLMGGTALLGTPREGAD